MSAFIVLISALALLSGVLAVHYWIKASKVMVMPMYEDGNELVPIPVEQDPSKWLHAIFIGIDKSGNLNKLAAIWTAISVALGTISSVISLLCSNFA